MTDRPWRDALNPDLLARLWRPVARPGLVRHQQAPAILARHQGMVAGLPLAALLGRRGTAELDAQTAQLPVVHARSQQLSAVASALPGPRRPRAAGPRAAGSQAAGSPAEARPVVRARRSQPPPAHTPPGPGRVPPPRTTGATLASGGSVQVVQRKPASAAAPAAPPAVGAAQPPATPHTEGQPVVPAARTAASRVAASGLPLIASLAASAGDAEAPAVASPGSAPLLPVVRLQTGRSGGGLSSVAPWTPPRAALERDGLPAVPVVRERFAAGRAAHLSAHLSASARQDMGLPLAAATVPATPWASLPAAPEQDGQMNGASTASVPPAVPVVHERLVGGHAAHLGPPPGQHAPLPLAAATAPNGTAPNGIATAAQASSGERTSRTGGHPPLASRGVVRMPAATAASETSHGSEPQRAVSAQIDLDRIVDQVQRKLMRRLTIAGERRGLSP